MKHSSALGFLAAWWPHWHRTMLIPMAVCSVLITPGAPPALAQQDEQIRIEDFCPTMRKRLKAQLANPLYKKALERKKQGKELPMSKRRLEYVESLRRAMKDGNCGKL